MARRSVLNRSFSTSEKVLMLVLAVLLSARCRLDRSGEEGAL